LVAVLREQLAAERQAHAEARRILAGLVERIPQLEAPREAPEIAEPHSAAGEAHDKLGAERTRREMAESTLHEGMAEERRRREAAERERDALRRELFGLRGREEAHESHEAAEEQQSRGQPQSATGGAQEPSESFRGRGSGTARGSWWRRMFRR
jgi:hypothetical protein